MIEPLHIAAIADVTPETAPTRHRPALAPRNAAYQVLLIEGDEDDATRFCGGVGEIDPDLAITTVTSLHEASDAMGAEFDCIVLDLSLPGSTDLDALLTVRAASPDTAIVVLTGWEDESVGTAAVAAGAQDYLFKGEATAPTIARSIRFAIERKHNEQATALLLRAQLMNVERERLERALLAAPSFHRSDLLWSTKYTAARTGVVSGDFIDGVELADGSIRVVIGDVAGHGPDEAALGVSLRAGWRALVVSDIPADAVLTSLENLLVTERSTSDAFATVCDLEITNDLRRITVRSAGHPPPVLAGAGPLVDANLRTPLGMRFGERRWVGTTFDLPPVWSIALYTDGLFEIRSASGQILSIDDVPAAVDNALANGVIDVDLLLAQFGSRSTEGWRDDVAVAVISSPGSAIG